LIACAVRSQAAQAFTDEKFSRREAVVAVADLVAEALTERFGDEIAGCEAEVVIDKDDNFQL
jgi:hypothetical protein